MVIILFLVFYCIVMFSAPFIWWQFNLKYKWYTKQDAADDKVELGLLVLAFVIWPVGVVFLLWSLLEAHYQNWLPEKRYEDRNSRY